MISRSSLCMYIRDAYKLVFGGIHLIIRIHNLLRRWFIRPMNGIRTNMRFNRQGNLLPCALKLYSGFCNFSVNVVCFYV